MKNKGLQAMRKNIYRVFADIDFALVGAGDVGARLQQYPDVGDCG